MLVCHSQAPGLPPQSLRGVTSPIGPGWGPKGRASHGRDPPLDPICWDYWDGALACGRAMPSFITFSLCVSCAPQSSQFPRVAFLCKVVRPASGRECHRYLVPALTFPSESMTWLWVKVMARSGQVLSSSAYQASQTRDTATPVFPDNPSRQIIQSIESRVSGTWVSARSGKRANRNTQRRIGRELARFETLSRTRRKGWMPCARCPTRSRPFEMGFLRTTQLAGELPQQAKLGCDQAHKQRRVQPTSSYIYVVRSLGRGLKSLHDHTHTARPPVVTPLRPFSRAHDCRICCIPKAATKMRPCFWRKHISQSRPCVLPAPLDARVLGRRLRRWVFGPVLLFSHIS